MDIDIPPLGHPLYGLTARQYSYFKLQELSISLLRDSLENLESKIDRYVFDRIPVAVNIKSWASDTSGLATYEQSMPEFARDSGFNHVATNVPSSEPSRDFHHLESHVEPCSDPARDSNFNYVATNVPSSEPARDPLNIRFSYSCSDSAKDSDLNHLESNVPIPPQSRDHRRHPSLHGKKLSKAEQQFRWENNLCIFCGKHDHIVSVCPLIRCQACGQKGHSTPKKFENFKNLQMQNLYVSVQGS